MINTLTLPLSNDSVAEFLLALKQAGRSVCTLKGYRSDLVGFTAWFIETNGERLSPDRITPTDLREYRSWLTTVRDLRPATVNRSLAAIKSFLIWAGESGLCDGRTASKMPEAVREVRCGPRWLDRREQNALRRAVEQGKNRRDEALVKFLINTGLRVQELCDLTWRDVTMSERRGSLTVRHGKGDKRREVPLNCEAREALRMLDDNDDRGDTHVFAGQRGPLTPRGVQSLLSKLITRQMERDGLEHLSPHMMRHTFCKNLVNAGVSLEKIATLAGHESLETTRRYIEPSHRDLEKAVELIGE